MSLLVIALFSLLKKNSKKNISARYLTSFPLSIRKGGDFEIPYFASKKLFPKIFCFEIFQILKILLCRFHWKKNQSLKKMYTHSDFNIHNRHELIPRIYPFRKTSTRNWSIVYLQIPYGVENLNFAAFPLLWLSERVMGHFMGFQSLGVPAVVLL